MSEETPANLENEKLLALGPQALSKAYLEILKKVQAGTILSPAEIKSFELLQKKLQGDAAPAPGEAAAAIVNSMEKVAEHFHKSLRQVQRWAASGMPVLSGGRYDLMQIELWRRLKKGGRGPAAPDGRQPTLVAEGDKDHWDMLSKREQFLARQMENQVRRGELVERSEVEKITVSRIMAVKQGLLSLGRALPPQLTNCQNEWEMEQTILRAIRELLEEFSRPLPETIGGSGAPALENHEPPAA